MISSSSSINELTLLRALSEALMSLLNKQSDTGVEISDSLKILGAATQCVSLSLVQLNQPVQDEGAVGLYRDRMAYHSETDSWEKMEMPVVNLPEGNPAIEQTLAVIQQQRSVRGKIAELSPHLQQQFQTPNSYYYLVYQIFLEELPWGVLVFNHSRPWTKAEEQALLPYTSALSNYLKREQTQRQLQRQRDYFRLILDSLPTAIISKNRAGQFLMVNKTFANLVETEPEDLIGKNEKKLLSNSALFDKIQEENAAIFESGHPLNIPRRLINEEGELYKYASINKIPLAFDDGPPEELLIVMSDISKEVKQEGTIVEEQRLNQGIAETMPDYLFLFEISPSGERSIVYHNIRQLLFGYDFTNPQKAFELFGEAIHYRDRKHAMDEFRARLNIAGDEDIISTSYRVKALDGTWHWISERTKVFKRYPNGKIAQYLSIIQDITAERNAQLEIRDREALFRGIYENSPNGIALVNHKGRFLRANPMYCEILGYSESELVQLTTWDVTHPDDLEQEATITQQVIMGGEAFTKIDKRYIRKDGTIVWGRLSVSYIYDKDKKLDMAMGIVEDITEQKLVQEKLVRTQKLQEAILNALPDIIVRVTPEGVVIQYYINAGIDRSEVPFFTPAKVTGRNLKEFLPFGVALGASKNIEKALRTGKVSIFDFKLLIKGRDMFLEARFNKINDQEVLIVLRNISTKKNYEIALNDKVRELRQKKLELEQYIQSNLQLENFAYLASHDLRQPLRMIRSFGDIIAQRYREQLDTDGQRYLDQITDNADYLNSMILDLLEYSRINAEKLEVSKCQVPELIHAVMKNLGEGIQEAGATIYIEDMPDVVIASYVRLRQVFQNLLSNAIRFRSPKRPLEIQIAASETKDFWQFSVVDNGIGIIPEMHEQVFVILKRLHARNEYDGTGLGLALCKTIVEHHQGKIWVESDLDQGATFSFTISKHLA